MHLFIHLFFLMKGERGGGKKELSIEEDAKGPFLALPLSKSGLFKSSTHCQFKILNPPGHRVREFHGANR